jgi:DNA-binding transcriptional MerR regulator
MAIESLMQQAGTFVDTLTVKPASTDKTASESSQDARVPEQGDSVTISEEARALAAAEESGDSAKSEGSKVGIDTLESEEDEEESEIDRIIRMLKEQIQRIQEEIKELEKSDMPEKLKRTMIQDKQVMLMELNDQLSEALEKKMKNIGGSVGGGTRAEGFGGSASSF